MPRRLRKRETTSAFSEFLAEHPGLWPPRNPRGATGDSLSEFETEVKPGDDRWLSVAAVTRRPTPKVHGYRHMLAVASVVLTIFAPAGVISSFIVGRELAVSPLSPPPLGGVTRKVGRPTHRRAERDLAIAAGPVGRIQIDRAAAAAAATPARRSRIRTRQRRACPHGRAAAHDGVAVVAWL